jgi:hypothetical protein
MTKYIVFWKYEPNDLDKVIEKSLKAQADAEKAPDKYAQYLFPPHHTGYCKGFSIVDVSNPDQMTRTFTYYFPELELKYVPIISNVDMLKTYKETPK